MTAQSTSDRARANEVPADLIARYDRPGPRYTSYPTAPEWGEMDDAAARDAFREMRSDDRPVSLYLHVPFCERMCLFCGCNVVVAKSHEKVARYLDCVKREASMVRELVGPKRLAQLHYGGGTPTFLTPEELKEITTALLCDFEPVEGAELGIEVDPMLTTRAHLEAARAVGFNRLSMGVQDFRDDVQSIVERNQPDSKTTEIFELGKSLGFESINLDLMYGLPGQTADHLKHSARRAVELGADRIAVFGYAHVPWMKPHQRKLEKHGIPNAEQRWKMFNAARVSLLEAGYIPIGMDHFARPDDELALAAGKRTLNRNFQGYTVLEGMSLIGLGVSSISDAGGTFLQNSRRLSTYETAIENGLFAVEKGIALNKEDCLRRDLIVQLMCNLFVDFDRIEERHGISFADHFAKELESLSGFVEDGLAERSDRSITITERGRVFMRNIAMAFDLYLAGKSADGEQRFSRTV